METGGGGQKAVLRRGHGGRGGQPPVGTRPTACRVQSAACAAKPRAEFPARGMTCRDEARAGLPHPSRSVQRAVQQRHTSHVHACTGQPRSRGPQLTCRAAVDADFCSCRRVRLRPCIGSTLWYMSVEDGAPAELHRRRNSASLAEALADASVPDAREKRAPARAAETSSRCARLPMACLN